MKPQKNRIAPDCAYCARGVGDSACRKKAESRGKPHCPRFKYDPLLRRPKPLLILGGQDDGDFKL